MRQSGRSTLILLLAIACSALLAPTLLAQQGRPIRSAPAEIATGTLVSFPGQPVRIPLAMPEGFPFGEAFWVPSPMRVRLFTPSGVADPIEPPAEIIGFRAASLTQPLTSSWLAPAWSWEIVRPDEVTEAPTNPVYWMLFVRLPDRFDAPNLRGQQNGRDQALILQIGDERFPLRLAQNPDELPTGRIPQLEADPDQWLALGDRLAPEAADPTRRWRINLLLDRVSSTRVFGSASLDDRFRLENQILRGLTMSIETEWRAAISDLAESDPDLAAALLARITSVIRMPSGELLPAWPTDGLAESQLLPSLLSRTLSQQERAEAARRYLDTRPRTRVTVLDDAGQSLDQEDSARFRNQSEVAERVFTASGARLLITNLSSADRTLTIGSPGEFDSTVVRIRPFESVETPFDPKLVRQVTENELTDRQPVTADAVVRDEGRETRAAFRVAPGFLQRPGLQIGPAMEPWTLASWNSDSVRSTRPELQTGLFLYRDDRDGGWKLLVEARTTSGLDDRLGESVSVYLGPYGSTGGPMVITAQDERTVHRSDRWSAIVDLSGAALDRVAADGTLAIGFTRIGPDQKRSSWPRPLLPSQDAPGRLRLDLSGWQDTP